MGGEKLALEATAKLMLAVIAVEVVCCSGLPGGGTAEGTSLVDLVEEEEEGGFIAA